MSGLELQLLPYRDQSGREPFTRWYERLDWQAASKVSMALWRFANGNLGEIKAVGAGVLERRIDWGPGYRVYFGRDGERLVILLGGGTKQRQQVDIVAAQRRWVDYRLRKREVEDEEG
jgi:putative addiction module killer protein